MDEFDVVFYDTIGMEFKPEDAETAALPGSEFTLMQVARELGERGFRVLIWFGREGDRGERTYGNVVYRYGHRDTPVTTRHLIHHRYASFGYEPWVRWEKRWFFCSDFWGVHYEPILARLAESSSFDGTICVSHWQAATFPAEARCGVLPNPLPAECYLSVPVRRDPNVFLYASAALKGLGPTLDIWTELRDTHPQLREARLRVLSPGYDDPALATARDGVELVGAVPFPRVVDEMRRAAGLFYVNDYQETFCIVAALAEACGGRVHMWMRNGGAVRETVNSPFVTTDGEQFKADFVRYFHTGAEQWWAEPHDYRLNHVVDLWQRHLGLWPRGA